MNQTTQIFISLIANSILGMACSYIAKKRGRHPIAWFGGGLFFGILAILALFILPARKTKATTETPTELKIPVLTPLSSAHAEKLWYYLDEKKQQFGPMSFNALSRAWKEGTVQEQTFVWNEEMVDWKHFKEVIKQEV